MWTTPHRVEEEVDNSSMRTTAHRVEEEVDNSSVCVCERERDFSDQLCK